MKKITLTLILVFVTFLVSLGQENGDDRFIYETFSTTRIINTQSIQTLKKGTMDFRVTHRFGDMDGAENTFFGLENASNIRIALEYGITNNLQIGIGRNKFGQTIDGFAKYALLKQTKDNTMPVSVTALTVAAMRVTESEGLFEKPAHRFSYAYQLMIARKFGEKLSMQVSPILVHRNYAETYDDENNTFALNGALKFSFTKRFAVVVDYTQIFSEYRSKSENGYTMPLGFGVELGTGGHLFSINVTNNTGIIPNHFVPYTTSKWSEMQFKLGFNISRIFKIR